MLLSTKKPIQIIIRMPNWLGDLVMATPLLESIKKKWPDSVITVACIQHLSEILLYHPYIDHILPLERQKNLKGNIFPKNNIKKIRKQQYDLGILTTNSLSSAWCFFLSNIKKRVGFNANARGILLTNKVPFPKKRKSQHLVKTYKSLLSPIGIPIDNTHPHIATLQEEDEAALSLLQSRGKMPQQRLIGINPGAAYGLAKCWPPERFIALGEKLKEKKRNCLVFFGDQSGKPLVDSICAKLPKEGVINLAGETDIRELVCLIKQCDVFLTNDSGPMHIAAALNIPLVALFGSTSDTLTGPYPRGHVIHKHTSCSPCFLRTCPIDFRCMKQIKVEEVYEALDSELSNS